MEPAATTPPQPPGRDDLQHLGEQIAELHAQITAATYQLLALIRDFDERGGWYSAYVGFATCAHWLSWRTGLSLGPAREHVRVARALGELPVLSEAMRQGRVSYSKIRALTRVATPDNEQELLNFALAGTAAHVERLVRAWRRVDRIEELEREALRHASRYLDLWTDEDGSVVVRGRLDPEAGAALIKAVEAGCDVLYEAEKENEATNPEAVPVGQRRADAIGRVAEAALAGGLDKGTRGDRYQVVVHVDASVLEEPEIGDVPAGTSRGAADPSSGVPAGTPERCAVLSNVSAETPPRCEVPSSVPAETPQGGAEASEPAAPGCCEHVPAGTSGAATAAPAYTKPEKPAVRAAPFRGGVPAGTPRENPDARGQSSFEIGSRAPAETAQRLACGASKVLMTHDSAGNVLDLGRKTRIVSPALRRALTHRDQTCRFPGCNVTYCDAHHVRHWARGGETRLDNLVLLCRRHHRCVHEEGYRVRSGPDGDLRFLRPDGRAIPDAPPPPPLDDDALATLSTSLLEAGVDLERMPEEPGWDGSALDLAWAIETLRPSDSASQ